MTMFMAYALRNGRPNIFNLCQRANRKAYDVNNIHMKIMAISHMPIMKIVRTQKVTSGLVIC